MKQVAYLMLKLELDITGNIFVDGTTRYILRLTRLPLSSGYMPIPYFIEWKWSGNINILQFSIHIIIILLFYLF